MNIAVLLEKILELFLNNRHFSLIVTLIKSGKMKLKREDFMKNLMGKNLIGKNLKAKNLIAKNLMGKNKYLLEKVLEICFILLDLEND